YYPVNYEAAIPSMKECLRIRSNERIDESNLALQTLALKHGARYIDINANLKDKLGRLKWSYTIDGMHITEEGYLSVFDDFMRYASEPKWKK
ncbi:MAG: lysophospholipase, partial [Oscillospiraceae bacterium]